MKKMKLHKYLPATNTLPHCDREQNPAFIAGKVRGFPNRGTKVAIIVGSDSDLPVIESATKVLEDFNVAYSLNVASAHRAPEYVKKCVQSAERSGAKVFIAAAGMSAALPGVVASETSLPVIGVPLEGKTLNGVDSLFSMVQMPPGIPVGTMALGKPGATNAAIFAIEILALNDSSLRNKIRDYRKSLSETIIKKDKLLNESGIKKYISRAQEK